MLKDRLILLRKQRNMSQYDVANRLGFSRGKLANYEQGTRKPNYETLVHIANFYDVSTDYLLGRTNNPKYLTSNAKEGIEAMYEINILLEKYGITQTDFFDIEKWKKAGSEGIKKLESYFRFIVEQAEKMDQENN